MFNRIIVIFALIMLAGSLAAQTDEGLELTQPQFLNPFYDSFARNFTGTMAAGRGHTGVATLGDITTFSLNPATNLPDSAKIVMELNIKPQINAVGYATEASYTSPNPLGLLAVGMGIRQNLSIGLAYSNPRSIRLEDYTIFINQGGAMVQRFPSYYLHQLTANVAYHRGPAHLGLNLHNQFHYIDDPIFLRTYDRIRDHVYSFRVQPGLLYELPFCNVGLSATLPSNFDWDQKYASYEVKQPLELNAGVAYTTSRMNLALDGQWEQFSKVNDAFDDRYTLKAGFEKYLGWLSYRLGYMYSSEVFSGKIMLPQNTFNPDESVFWNDVADSLMIDANNQHFATVGLSYMHRDGAIHLALIQSLSSKAPQTQLNLSLSFYLKSFRHRGVLKFDD